MFGTVTAVQGNGDLGGGGSSTLVGCGSAGEPVVVNRPSGLGKRPGTLRYVAVSLGFTGLRRTGKPLPACADWRAPWYARTWEEAVVELRVRPLRWVLTGLAVMALILTGFRLRRRYRSRSPGGS